MRSSLERCSDWIHNVSPSLVDSYQLRIVKWLKLVENGQQNNKDEKAIFDRKLQELSCMTNDPPIFNTYYKWSQSRKQLKLT